MHTQSFSEFSHFIITFSIKLPYYEKMVGSSFSKKKSKEQNKYCALKSAAYYMAFQASVSLWGFETDPAVPTGLEENVSAQRTS